MSHAMTQSEAQLIDTSVLLVELSNHRKCSEFFLLQNIQPQAFYELQKSLSDTWITYVFY